MTSAWFFDALDSRAGLAFASYRGPDLANVSVDFENPAVYIAAPDFRAETVTNRAVGFAAARSAFQLGLFVEGAEVGFRSLDEIIEFVRRAYLNGGGGDEPEGSPPRFPERPDLGGGHPLPETEGHFKSPNQLLGLLEQFKILPRKLDLLSVKDWGGTDKHPQAFLADSTGPTYGGASVSEDPAELLSITVAKLAEELILRFPENPDQQGSWLDSIKSLGIAASRMNLPTYLLSGQAAQILTGAGDYALSRHGKHIYGGPWPAASSGNDRKPDRITAAIGLLLVFDHAFALADGTWIRALNLFGERSDRFDDLGLWPLPPSVCKRRGLTQNNHSLADLLSVATGAPASGNNWELEDAGLILFAAMHLQCFRCPNFGGVSFSVARNWRIALANQAHFWLQQELPKCIFPAKIEQVIGQSLRVQYA